MSWRGTLHHKLHWCKSWNTSRLQWVEGVHCIISSTDRTRASGIIEKHCSQQILVPQRRMEKTQPMIKNVQTTVTVHQTMYLPQILRWFRCCLPVSCPVMVLSWRWPQWVPGNSKRQSAWRRMWRNYWFSGDGMFYWGAVSVRVRARNLWLIIYLRHFCAW